MSILHRHHGPETQPSVTANPNYQPPVTEGSGSNGGNLPPNNEKGNSPFNRRNFLRLGAAAGLLAVGIGAGIKVASGDRNTTPPRSETTTSAPAETPSASVTPSEITPSATETIPAFHYTPENPALIAALEAMTPAEFAKQPGSARRAWIVSKLAETLYDGATSRAFVDPLTIEAYTLQDGTELLEHTPIPPDPTDPDTKTTPLTRNSSPKEVFEYDLYIRNLVSSWENDELNGQGKSGKDKATAEKLLSGNIESTTSEEYRNDLDSLENSTKLTAMKTKELSAYDVIGASPRLYKVKDSEGEVREAQTITYSANNGHNNMEYVFEEIPEFGKSPEGLPYGIWLRTERKPLN